MATELAQNSTTMTPTSPKNKFHQVQSQVVAELIRIFPELVLVPKLAARLQDAAADFFLHLSSTAIVQVMWNYLVLGERGFLDAFNKPAESNLLLHFIWFSSHCATFLLSIISFAKLFQNHGAIIYCQAALTSSSLTYLVVTYRHLTLLAKTNNYAIHSLTNSGTIPLSQALKSENTYLLLSCFLTLQSNLQQVKIVSFVVYAFLNIFSTILDEYIHGTTLSGALLPLLLFIEEPLLNLAATVDTCVFPFSVAESASKRRFIDLAMIIFIFGLRLEASVYLRRVTLNNTRRIHGVFKSVAPQSISRPFICFFELTCRLMASPLSQDENSEQLNNPKQRRGRVASLQFEDEALTGGSY